MQFPSLLLWCSALLAIAYPFPTGTENITTTTLPQNETTTSNTKGNKRPLVFIMEERDPKSDSVLVQFVYSSNGGNSVIESKSSDKDKYNVDHVVHKEKREKSNTNVKEKEKHEEKSSMNVKEKEKHEEKSLYVKEKEKLAQKPHIKKAALGKMNKPKTSSTKDVQMMAVPTLTQDEISPLSGKWPKYVIDVLNPVPPFPELQFGKSNKMNTKTVQKENSDSFLPNPTNERKEPLNVAGPQLNPLSIYDREFNVPIFV